MSDSVQVAIKVRPLIQREKTENLQIQWTVLDNALVPTDSEKRRAESGYKFDHVFGPEKNNQDVFEIVVQPIVDAAVNGFNGTVFAYGQTSSGKTHTMMGIPNEPGIIPMAVERMFNSIDETSGREFLLRVSYIEIYNEKVNDLLDTDGIDLKLREDSNGLVQVLRCKEEIASSPEVIMSIMKKGDKNRRIGETDMNERSSRSHSIFRITIESRDMSSDSDGAIQVSQLNLVDLAGSERARQTNATGERFKEGTHINMSLSTLGLVIKQLSESSDGTKYINFRDSKLTRLLQASLGGNAMTTIICAVTPAAFEETQCTLWFASRAKSVKNKPHLNEVMSDAALLKRYKKQLAKLNEELDRTKQESRIAEVQEMESKLQEKEHILQEKDRINQILEERIQLLKSSIVSAGSSINDENNGKISKPKRRRTWAGDQALSTQFNWTTGQNLPTINEVPSPSPDFKSNHQHNSHTFKNYKGRKSIIQTVDLNNESFQVAFTDFELELIQVEKERTAERDVTFNFTDDKNSRKMITTRSVSFQDDVQIHRLSTGSNWREAPVTPEKTRFFSNEGNRDENSLSPGTPKSVLRERVTYLTEELKTLEEFTTLERQMMSAQNSELPSDNERIIIQKTIDKLISEKERLFKENIELKSQKEDLFKENTELKSQKEHLIQENIELNSEKEHLFKENTELKSEKEHLLKENTELKIKITDESAKLKNANTLINTLRSDTDCLMERVIQKNRELAKLKERISSLEKLTEIEILTENSVNKSTTVIDECKDTVSDSSEFNLSAKQESVINTASFVKSDNLLSDKDSVCNSSESTSIGANTKNCSKSLSKNCELESSSIFVNMTYFDNMEVSQSVISDCTNLLIGINESKDVSNIIANANLTTGNDLIQNRSTPHAEEINVLTVDQNIDNVPISLEELEKVKADLEKENEALSFELQKKNHEIEEVQKVVSDFKLALEKLQETIIIQTNENMDLSRKLFESKEIADNEIRDKFLDYGEKLKLLQEENVALSTELMEKIEEFEKVKESKVLIYDHECIHKDRSDSLVEKVELLEKENIKLSSELTEQIEKYDKLKETTDLLKQQFDTFSENLDKDVDTSSIPALTVIDEDNKLISTDCADTGHCSIALQTSKCDESSNETNNVLHLTEKIKCLEQQVEHLTLLNEKLGELKLPNCSKCASFKELNESRRKLKLEVKSLTQKLSELQQKFEQKCSDTEILKAKKSINESLSLMDTSLNDTAYEECNISAIENTIKSLYNEIEELKENHNTLSNQYNEKCNELDLLQLNNSSTSTEKKEKRSKIDSNRNISVRIQTLHKDFENLSSDLQEFKKCNSNIGSTLIKLEAEQAESNKIIESLRSMNKELKNEFDAAKISASNSEERIKLLEEELAALYKQVEVASNTEKEIQVQKLEIEVQLEILLKEKAELTNLVQDSHISYNKKMDELKELEEIVKELKLKTENNFQDKLQEEIDGVKFRIIQEIKSLSSLSENELKNLPEQSVIELLSSFLKVILSKETEIIKRVEKEFERKKQKLEEEKQQSIDGEKRAKVWAKTVETDLEKLQIDFTEQEQKNQRLCDKIHTLKENLKEAHHDNQQLRMTIAALENEMNSLVIELDKKSKWNDSAAQEKEKLAKNKEEEWENRLKVEKEYISQEIDHLKEQLNMSKAVNDDLRSTIQDLKNTNEGLDCELEHLRNTIEIKTKDFIASMNTIEKLKQEIECLEEINTQLKIENEEKDKKVNEITDLLKTKCDVLDRYKTKVETITPEYENLKVQILERKLLIEKYKNEIHDLKMDSKNKLELIQDKLTSEEIKSAVLNEQIAKFKYEHTALSSTIGELKDRCTELERENKNLNEKVKKSTSDLQNETEMQEMRNEIRFIKNELEELYKRIKELKTSKSLIEQELMEVHGKNELIEQELNTTKSALESLREKHNNWNIQTLLEKNELLMQEKHNILLEIQEKNMIIANKEQQLVELEIFKKENAELNIKNKELDDKMNGLVSEILQLKNENAELQDKIIAEQFDKEKFLKLVFLEEEYEKLQENLRIKEREKNELLREKNEMMLQLENCKKENAETNMKNKELDDKMNGLASEILQLKNENTELQDKIISEQFDKEKFLKLVFLEEEYEKLQENLRIKEREKNEILREKNEKLLQLENYKKENAELNMKNKELDEEMDGLASEILQLKDENAELQDKIITEHFDKERCLRLVFLEEEYEKLQVNQRITEREKNALLREKNEMLLKLENCKKENAELNMKNNELDEEMDGLASEILQLKDENAELQDKIITEHFDKDRCLRLVFLEEEYEKLQANLRTLQYEKSTLQNKMIQLHSEKELLQNQIKDLNDKIVELESVNLLNQNRNINVDSDWKDIVDIESQSIPSISTPTVPLVQSIDKECRTCHELGERVRQMSLELVYKESQILIVQNALESKSSSYQMKCKELEANLLINQTRNSGLILKIQNLQDILNNCNKCNEGKVNKKDQAVQVKQVNKIQMTGMSSGIVEDYVRIEKLEKEKNFMKDLCRNRLKRIKELENRIKELES